jgi:chromosome segregation ATPase
MAMIEQEMVQAEGEWRQRIGELKELIRSLEVELVDAEAELTELLAALNAFEFQLRAGIDHLVQRLEGLAAEIAELRRQLRRGYDYFDDLSPGDWSFESMEDAYREPGIDYDDYRYHSPLPEPPAGPVFGDQREELKKLYRQLARRFHPDMGAHEADREYRTQLMMVINAAYAAGDLARLQALANEPDLDDLTAPADDAELLVAFLLKEMARLQRRQAEIRQELTQVRQKKNCRLMQRARMAEAAGRDWLVEMKEQLQEEIRHKLVERDVLQQELASQESDAELSDLHGEAFADAVWDMTLETAYDIDPDLEAEDWLSRHQKERYWYDDDLDEILD